MPQGSPVNRRQFSLKSPAALAAFAFAACTEQPALAAAATKLPGRQAYELAATGNGFSVGPIMSANTVYVYFDTTCPHCAHLWENIQALKSRVKSVWMPVGFLRPQSGPQGATILSAADPSAAMTENETKVLARQGGISVSPTLAPEALAKVKANTAILEQLGVDSVPLILFRNAKTGEYSSQTGAPTTEQLISLIGL